MFSVTLLSSYLSQMLCNDDTQGWEAVLKSLLGVSKFRSAFRIAKGKCNGERSICRTMILDWMKSQAVQNDKVYLRTPL